MSWDSESTLKDLLRWLGNPQCIIGYSDDFDRVPPHFVHIQIVFCAFGNIMTCLPSHNTRVAACVNINYSLLVRHI